MEPGKIYPIPRCTPFYNHPFYKEEEGIMGMLSTIMDTNEVHIPGQHALVPGMVDVD